MLSGKRGRGANKTDDPGKYHNSKLALHGSPLPSLEVFDWATAALLTIRRVSTDTVDNDPLSTAECAPMLGMGASFDFRRWLSISITRGAPGPIATTKRTQFPADPQ
jgi:hypothetical protein